MQSSNRSKQTQSAPVSNRRSLLARTAMLSAATVAAMIPSTPSAQAANIQKADNTNNLNLGTSWVGGVAPGVNDIAVWDSTVTSANNVLLGANSSWLGLSLTNPTGDVAIGAGNTLTLGISGINMSMAATNLAISSGLTIGAGNQVWNVNTGRTLTLNTGAFTRSAGATLNLQGSGTVTSTMTGLTSAALTNSILPWATIGTGTSTRFATFTGSTLTSYAAATAASTAASAWGGIPSGGTGTINYNITIAGTPGVTGLNRNVNSILYTGTGMIQNGNTNALLLNTNSILNAGTGVFQLGSTGTAFSISSSSAANELILHAANAGITVGPVAVIANNGAAVTSVTIAGANTVAYSGANIYTGATNINGTLAISGGNAIANTGAVVVNNGGTFNVNASETIGSLSSAPSSSVAIGNAFTLTAGDANSTTAAGVISGTTGGLTKAGAGILTLTGSNTYGGNTTISAGTLQIGNGGTTGSLSTNSAIVDNATLAFNRSNNVDQGVDFRGASITGTGAVQQIGTNSKLTLNVSNGYAGGTTIGAGQNNSAILATATNALGGGTINFDAGGNASTARLELSGGITLNNAVTAFQRGNTNAAILNVSGNNTMGGTISLTTGGAQFPIQSDAGLLTLSAATAITTSGGASARNVYLQGAGDGVVSGIIANGTATGGLGVTKAGGGTWTLTGANTYTSATTINAGTLQIGNGGTTGSLAGTAITNNSNLTLNRSDALALTSTIGGTGTLTHAGPGTTTLNGAASYSGATNVDAGSLIYAANSSIGTVNVANGAGLGSKAAAAGSTVLTTTNLNLGVSGANNLSIDFNSLNPTVAQISTGNLALNGMTTLSFAGTGALTTNTYTIIDYGTFGTGSLANFASTSYTFGHSSGTLVNNDGNTSIDLNVIADSVIWSGNGAQTWQTAATGDSTPPNDWATKSGLVATNFWANDAVEFNDTYDIGAGPVAVTNRTVTVTGADVSPAGVIVNNSTGDYTITGSFGIAGSGTLVKNGSSKLTLNTVNSYTGGTTVNGGTVSINSNTSFGAASGPLTLNNATLETTATISTTRNITVGSANSAILTDSGTTYTVTGLVSGSGAVNKNGAGTLVFGSNTYSGGTTINAGTLQLTSTAGAANLGTFNLNGAHLQINVATSNFAYNPAINVSADSTFSSIGAGQINYTGTMVGSTNVLSVNSGASRLYMNGAVSGISQFNVTAGAMGFDLNVGNRGGGAPVNVSSGASLYFANATNAIANNLTINGTGQATLGALFQEGAGNPTISGSINLATDSSVGGNTAAANVAVTGQVTGSGKLTKIGANTYTLSNAANNYSGGTTVAGGVLNAGNSNALGSGNVSVSAVTGAQLQLGSGVNVGNNLTINGGGVLAQGVLYVPTGNATYSGPITISAATNAGGHFASNAGVLTVDGAVSATVPVTVRAGTVVLNNAANTFNVLNVQGGTARVGIAGAIPSTATVDLGQSAAATLDLNGLNQTVVGVTKNTNAATISNSQAATTSTLTTTGTSTYGGAINNGTGTTALTVNSGQLTLTGASNFTGDINVNGGTLVANLVNNVLNPTTTALGNTQVARNINVASGATLKLTSGDTFGSAVSTVGSTLVVNGGTVTNNGNNFNTLGAVQLNGGTLTGTGGAVVGYQMYNLRGSVTVGGSTLSTLSGSGANSGYHLASNTTFNVGDVAAGTDLAVSGALINQDATNTGNGGLTKSGLGTMVLTGANTYGGATNVNGGTLVVGVAGVGSISGTGTVTVNSTATLAGSGSVAGGVTVASGGTLAPGNSPGLFTTGGNVTLGGSYAWEFDNGGVVGTAGTNYDQLVMTNASATLALGGTVDVSLTTGNYANSFWDSNHQWTIISTANGSGTTGSFSGITAPGSTGEGVFTYSTSGGSVVLDWTAAVTGNTVTLVSGSSNSPVLTINGGNGSYIGASADVTGATGGVNITGFNPATDAPVLIALDIENLSGSLSDFLSSITAPAGYTLVSATDISSSVPGWVTQVNQFSQSINDWEALLSFAPTTPNGSPFDFNWNFTGNGGAIVDRIAVVPEPATFGVVGALGAIGLLKRRRRKI